MIKQLPKSGAWVVTGVTVPAGQGDIPEDITGSVVLVSNAEMQAFITERVKEHTEHALKILIEHQRHALLPEQNQGHDK